MTFVVNRFIYSVAVDGMGPPNGRQFLEGGVDEDNRNQGGKTFLCESGNITNLKYIKLCFV